MSAKKQTPLVEWVRQILQGKIKVCSLLCQDLSVNLSFVNWEINCSTMESDFKLVKYCVVTLLSVAQLEILCPWLARQQLSCIIPSFPPFTFFNLTEHPIIALLKAWMIQIRHQKELKSSSPVQNRPWMPSCDVQDFPGDCDFRDHGHLFTCNLTGPPEFMWKWTISVVGTPYLHTISISFGGRSEII